jgi:hypothetical protein
VLIYLLSDEIFQQQAHKFRAQKSMGKYIDSKQNDGRASSGGMKLNEAHVGGLAGVS